MTASLTVDQQQVLSTASRSRIEQVFEGLYPHFRGNHWTGPNAYLSDTIGTIKDDVSNSSIRHADLEQYIAASAPIHCVDGWAYLGRAMACLSQGDASSARHLGYYAELRAAMSLLASCGIGIFDHDHIVVDSSGTCVPIPLPPGVRRGRGPGTHQITWQVLEFWATSPDTARLIGEIIRPLAIPLQQWLTSFTGGAGLTVIAADWIRSWGLDLRMFQSDRDARNIASYRPSRLSYAAPLGVTSIVPFLNDIWSLSAPTRRSRFDVLDRFLLRKSLIQAFTATPAARPVGLRPRVERTLSDLLPATDPSILVQYADFFADEVRNPYPELLDKANRSDPSSSPQHPLQVIGRAFLLLRIATGSSSHLVKALPSPSADLEFWWKKLGLETGLWDSGHEPGSDADEILVLWDDAQDALERLDLWASNVSHPSYNNLLHNEPEALWVLQGCERIAMWGLLP